MAPDVRTAVEVCLERGAANQAWFERALEKMQGYGIEGYFAARASDRSLSIRLGALVSVLSHSIIGPWVIV
jgi:hypothetical protein